MQGDRRNSGEPEIARRKDFKGNAAFLTGSHKIPSLRWSALPEAETNKLPAMVLVRTERRRKGMEAAHGLSRHGGRKGALRQEVDRYW